MADASLDLTPADKPRLSYPFAGPPPAGERLEVIDVKRPPCVREVVASLRNPQPVIELHVGGEQGLPS